jgi:hypothetical protein
VPKAVPTFYDAETPAPFRICDMRLDSPKRSPPKANLRRFVPYQLSLLLETLKRTPDAFVTAICFLAFKKALFELVSPKGWSI